MHHTEFPPRVADDERRVDQAALTLLFDEPGPWSLDELARELGSRADADDTVARLHGLGLVDGVGHLVPQPAPSATPCG